MLTALHAEAQPSLETLLAETHSSGMKALLVAEPGRHVLLEQVLRQRGHGLAVISEPAAAVKAQQSERFPLVFLEASAIVGRLAAPSALAREFGEAALVALVDGDHSEQLSAAVAAGAADWMQQSSPRDLLEARIAVLERTVAHIEEDRRLRERLGATERERARLDENLHRLLDASPDPIAVHRGDVVLYGNPAAAMTFGFESAAVMLGCPIYDLIHPDDHSVVRARCRSVLETGQPAELREERFLRRDGAELVGEAYSFRIEFEGRYAVMTVGRDLTEPRLLQTQLLHSERLATIGSMTAAIAHELKNPLTYVTCNLADLCHRLPGLKGRLQSDVLHGLEARVDAAIEGVERLRVIAQDLSRFSRSRDEELRSIELGRVLDGALRMASPELHALSVNTDLCPAPNVLGSEIRLSQVFLNLLINAAHAVREKACNTGRVEIRCHTDASGWAVVEVSDNGVGIPAALLPNIFEPFFTTKSLGAGTGLGLSVARTIISGLNGEISAESESGVGTTFRVRLPPVERT